MEFKADMVLSENLFPSIFTKGATDLCGIAEAKEIQTTRSFCHWREQPSRRPLGYGRQAEE